MKMYYNCGTLEDAETIVNFVQEKDAVCLNTVIAAYVQLWQSRKAFVFLEKMVVKGVSPSQTIYITLFTLCVIEGF